ncbi:hypothetical protein [Paenibacillus kribbensis]|uniref:hypothetical protein n=1 Tax=Paenibacillus kribbensis TaxID=172713 RepID=UPI002118DE51|nr:hypothetical protein [Paenibacillus kribbensis]
MISICTDKDLTIRPVKEEDLHVLWTLTYKEEAPEWKQWDAPYYEHKALSFEDYLIDKNKRVEQDDFWLIEVEGKIIGSVAFRQKYFSKHEKMTSEFISSHLFYPHCYLGLSNFHGKSTLILEAAPQYSVCHSWNRLLLE